VSLRITEIRFNHDTRTARSSALNIRLNASTPVAVPEWRAGAAASEQNSVAAYALNATRGLPIFLKARFRSTQPVPARVEVRAVEPEPARWLEWLVQSGIPAPEVLAYYLQAGYIDYYTYLYYLQLWQTWAAAGANVLGEVQPTAVTFDSQGRSALVSLPLQNVRMASRGVGVYPVRWLWQYRAAPGDAWTDMTITQHRIYVVLDVPTEPWRQQPFTPQNTQLPWVEVLDFACRWAEGALTASTAAQRITEAVFDLGEDRLRYGCLIGSHEMYCNSLYNVFFCTAFLERLKGGIGNGEFVNCTDCATVVSTFANSLGGDLWQSRMGEYLPPFQTNPILVIGDRFFNNPCGVPSGFSFHEVAWEDNCAEGDAVYDACLATDVDLLPGGWPYHPVVPANIRFGSAGEGLYRDRLSKLHSRFVCRPRPQERRRRTAI
jgi:hypothetical protein